MAKLPRAIRAASPGVVAPLLALLVAGCTVDLPPGVASGVPSPSPSVSATPSSSASAPPSSSPSPSPSPSPASKKQYELVDKEILVLVKESGLPATDENKMKAAALGVEWSREGEVTVTAKADHAGQTNVMKVKMAWTPLPSTFSEGDVLPVELAMDVLENQCPTMGLGANMHMGVRFGPYLVAPEAGNPVVANKNTPVGTQIRATVKEPVPGGGDTVVIDVLAKAEQAGGVQYFYHYRLKK